MGTRADFYATADGQLDWRGSIAWDGYPSAVEDVTKATTEDEWRALLDAFLASREDATLSAQGWPWPWEDSNTTGYAYRFDGVVLASRFGSPWFPATDEPDEVPPGERPVFPNMKKVQKVTLGPRSGVIIVEG